MKNKVLKIWPEINWIKDESLREKTLEAWVYAIENSPLEPKDLETIPFSLLIKDCDISFMNHKRTCVQLAVDIAKTMVDNFGNQIKLYMYIMISGAILIDVGKLLEYETQGNVENFENPKTSRFPRFSMFPMTPLF